LSADEVNPKDFYCLERPRPKFRGRIHEALYLTSPLWCVYALHLCKTWEAMIAAVLSLGAAVFVFRSSSTYHRHPWKDVQTEFRAQQIDFISISTMIAYSFAPAQAILLDYGVSIIAISTVLAVASACAALSDTSRFIRTGIYLAQGVVAAGIMIPMAMTSFELACVITTAACYILGAVGYAFQKPALWPEVFGFHEMWHLLIGIAATGTYLANLSIIDRAQAGLALPDI